jgi:hypothetical protein
MAGRVADAAPPCVAVEASMPERDRDHERMDRLEEAVLFAERRLDLLHEEMLACSARLEKLSARIAALELAGVEPEDEPDGG